MATCESLAHYSAHETDPGKQVESDWVEDYYHYHCETLQQDASAEVGSLDNHQGTGVVAVACTALHRHAAPAAVVVAIDSRKPG